MLTGSMQPCFLPLCRRDGFTRVERRKRLQNLFALYSNKVFGVVKTCVRVRDNSAGNFFLL